MYKLIIFFKLNKIAYMYLSLKIIFVLANSVDTYEMSHLATFHQGLHCMQKDAFKDHYYIKG